MYVELSDDVVELQHAADTHHARRLGGHLVVRGRGRPGNRWNGLCVDVKVSACEGEIPRIDMHGGTRSGISPARSGEIAVEVGQTVTLDGAGRIRQDELLAASVVHVGIGVVLGIAGVRAAGDFVRIADAVGIGVGAGRLFAGDHAHVVDVELLTGHGKLLHVARQHHLTGFEARVGVPRDEHIDAAEHGAIHVRDVIDEEGAVDAQVLSTTVVDEVEFHHVHGAHTGEVVDRGDVVQPHHLAVTGFRLGRNDVGRSEVGASRAVDDVVKGQVDAVFGGHRDARARDGDPARGHQLVGELRIAVVALWVGTGHGHALRGGAGGVIGIGGRQADLVVSRGQTEVDEGGGRQGQGTAVQGPLEKGIARGGDKGKVAVALQLCRTEGSSDIAGRFLGDAFADAEVVEPELLSADGQDIHIPDQGDEACVSIADGRARHAHIHPADGGAIEGLQSAVPVRGHHIGRSIDAEVFESTEVHKGQAHRVRHVHDRCDVEAGGDVVGEGGMVRSGGNGILGHLQVIEAGPPSVARQDVQGDGNAIAGHRHITGCHVDRRALREVAETFAEGQPFKVGEGVTECHAVRGVVLGRDDEIRVGLHTNVVQQQLLAADSEGVYVSGEGHNAGLVARVRHRRNRHGHAGRHVGRHRFQVPGQEAGTVDPEILDASVIEEGKGDLGHVGEGRQVVDRRDVAELQDLLVTKRGHCRNDRGTAIHEGA